MAGGVLTAVVHHIYVYNLLGVMMLFAVDRNKGREPFSVFSAINIVSEHPVVLAADILICCALGGLVVFLLTDPQTIQQAVVTGLGTTGILSTLGKAPSPAKAEDQSRAQAHFKYNSVSIHCIGASSRPSFALVRTGAVEKQAR